MAPRNRTTQPAQPAAPESQPAQPAAPANPDDVLAKVSRSIVPIGYRDRLVKHTDVKTAAGNPTIDNGDPVADALRGKSLADVWNIATEALGLEVVTALHSKYDKLNPGQQRMNLGNRLRAMFRTGVWKPAAK